jgi:hypothetical protein
MNEHVNNNNEGEMRANRQRIEALGRVLLLWLGIGVALALLFGIRAGIQLRKELAAGVEERREATNKAINQLEKEFDDLRKGLRNS